MVWERVKDQLQTDELAIARRARNAKSTAPRTATVASYRRATALEALIGYLYLTGQEGRIEALLNSSGRNQKAPDRDIDPGHFRVWLGCRDSNPDYLFQRQASYR